MLHSPDLIRRSCRGSPLPLSLARLLLLPAFARTPVFLSKREMEDCCVPARERLRAAPGLCRGSPESTGLAATSVPCRGSRKQGRGACCPRAAGWPACLGVKPSSQGAQVPERRAASRQDAAGAVGSGGPRLSELRIPPLRCFPGRPRRARRDPIATAPKQTLCVPGTD